MEKRHVVVGNEFLGWSCSPLSPESFTWSLGEVLWTTMVRWALLVYGLSKLSTCCHMACGKGQSVSPSPLCFSSPQGQLPPTLQERQRLKEILPISAFTYHSYTYLEKYSSHSTGKPFPGHRVMLCRCSLLRGHKDPNPFQSLLTE